MFPEKVPERTLKIIGLDKQKDDDKSNEQSSSASKLQGPKKRGTKKIDFSKDRIDIQSAFAGDPTPINEKMT